MNMDTYVWNSWFVLSFIFKNIQFTIYNFTEGGIIAF